MINVQLEVNPHYLEMDAIFMFILLVSDNLEPVLMKYIKYTMWYKT